MRKISFCKQWTATRLLSKVMFLLVACLAISACGGDDDDEGDNGSGNDGGSNGAGEEQVDFEEPSESGWTDYGKTCYYVTGNADSRIMKQHNKYEFNENSDDATCVNAVCEILSTDAKAAEELKNEMAQLGASVRNGVVVSYPLSDEVGKTKKEIHDKYVKDTDPDPEPAPTRELNTDFFIGKWVISSVRSALGDEEAILAGDQYRTQRWEFKADGSAVWSYRNWSSKWNMYDPWNESPKTYTWEFSVYNKDTYVFLIIKHEGKPGFGDYKKTITRRYIKIYNDNWFYWENDYNEKLDGKPYHVSETYVRDGE